MANVDWDKIKAEYLAGGTSYRKLAKKYGISAQAVTRRAIKEKWTESLEKVRSEVEAKVEQKIASQRASDIAKLDRARSKLIDKLSAAIDKYPDIPGNRTVQSVSDIILSDEEGDQKKGGAKQKHVQIESDILKMIKGLEMLMGMSGLDVRTQIAQEDLKIKREQLKFMREKWTAEQQQQNEMVAEIPRIIDDIGAGDDE